MVNEIFLGFAFEIINNQRKNQPERSDPLD